MNNIVDKTNCINPQDWTIVLDSYKASEPYNYVIIDNFLTSAILQQLHQDLLNHPGWHKQTHTEYPIMSNMSPDLEIISTIAKTLKANCPDLLSNYELVEHWALMYSKNVPGKIHSDIGALTVNIWLTPDEYNLDTSAGGLVFFDVKRSSSVSSEHSLSYLWSEQYLKDFTKGQKVSVSYKCNRALLFDAKTFHQTDKSCFVNNNPQSHRINLSMAFDDPILYNQQVSLFKEGLNNDKFDS